MLFGQHSSCRSGTASHFPVAIALQKAVPWVCRSVCLLLNPTSKCFCHSFCRELFSMSIHWEAPGEMVISFPARTFEGPFYNGGHLEGDVKRGESFLICSAENFSFSYKYCHYLILQFKMATAIKSASRCFAERNYFSVAGFLAL